MKNEGYRECRGTLEDLISDIDGVCHIYDPDDIDTVYSEQLERKVAKFLVKKEKKGVLVDVYLQN